MGDLEEDIDNRCDLSPFFLPKSELMLRNNGGDRKIATVNLYKELYETFQQKTSGLAFLSVVHFAWHKLLNIIGGSLKTRICLFTEKTSEVSIQVLDHKSIELQKIHTAIRILSKKPSSLIDATRVFTKDSYSHDAVFAPKWSKVPIKDSTLLIFSFDEETLELRISFSQGVYEKQAIQRFLDITVHLIEQIINNLDEAIANLQFVPKKQLMEMKQWNETSGEYPKYKRLNTLFEEAAESADASQISVRHNNTSLSYHELNSKANQFARFMNKHMEIQTEQFVGLFLDKSIATVLSVLGLWKCGAAVVAIDPAYPDKRVRFSITNTDLKVIVTQEKYKQRLINLCDKDIIIVSIEDINKESKQLEDSNFSLKLTSDQLAYISFTSGTTGVPKGILKYHSSLVNSITDLSRRYDVKDSNFENVVLYSSYVFEPFYRQMLMALINGHCLHLVDDDIKMDVDEFSRFLEVNKITYLNGTPSILQEYNYTNCPHLKRLILVGEQLTRARYETLRQKFCRSIIVEYGFTESAFVTCLKQFEAGDNRKDSSLGRPVQNVKCYVLDKDLKQVPIGVVGILFVGGAGVSVGYHNNDVLTAQRFISNPYQTILEKEQNENSRLYKTGDLVSWTDDGQLLFYGRSDFQIKLRGLRIEPGEIESVLTEHPSVERCAVVVKCLNSNKEDELGRQLVAFYTHSRKSYQPLENNLLAYLETILPRYMIPSRIVPINKIPTNINGKVNLETLPEVPLATSGEKSRNGSDLEIAMQKIWSEVLNVPMDFISPDANFFMLGGNSIHCVQIAAQMQRQLHMFISSSLVFQFKTIRNLISHCMNKRENEIPQSDISVIQPLTETEFNLSEGVEDVFLANSLQQGLAYHHFKQNQNDDAYIMQSSYKYDCTLNLQMMELAWIHAQQKYSTLRSRFVLKNTVYQVIDIAQPPNIKLLNFSSSQLEFQHQMEALLQSDREEKYDLSKGSLFRIYLVQDNEKKSMLVFSCHHIIIDGWSLPILFEFVHQTYLDLLKGKDVVYICNQSFKVAQKYLQSKQDDSLEFWENTISNISDRCDLTGWMKNDLKKVSLSTYDFVKDQKEEAITITCSTALNRFCTETGLTMNSVIQFVWHQVLHLYGNGDQSIVGTTFSGRNVPVEEIDQCVGMLINTLPVIINHSDEKSVSVQKAIEHVQETINAVNSRSHFWLGKLPTGITKHQLFDSLFVFENYPYSISEKVRQTLGLKKVFNFDKLDYPLTVIISLDSKDQLIFKLVYAGELFDVSVIRDVLMLVDYLLQQIVKNPAQAISKLDFIIPKQKEQINTFNQTYVPYSLNKCLHEVFEEKVISCGKKLAVVYEHNYLQYAELNSYANQLAQHLISVKNVKKGDIIALFQDKSELLIVSILAIWKCGAAFVPIATDFPDSRIQFIMEDTSAKLVLSNSWQTSSLHEKIMLGNENVIEVDKFNFDKSSVGVGVGVGVGVDSRDLAYTIYTSGTTGNPKGVIVEHRGVLNLKYNMEDLFQFKDEVIMSFSNYIFDHFIEQMIDGILTGQTLVLLNDELRYNPEKLYDYMKSNKVTYLSGTPSVVSQYKISDLPHLKRVDVVGEDLNEDTFNKIRNGFSGLIINGYGPTEISITSHKKLYPYGLDRTNKSIGYQINNSKCYVVNKRRQLLPIGAVGEMLIGGVGVARGYLNRKELTNEKFIPNMFGAEDLVENNRLYTTGDQVRWLKNGEIEYLGRVDQQVKIRGIRIEIGEIESVLGSHPAVRQVAVQTQEQKNGVNMSSKRLVAFCSLNFNATENELKVFATARLPFWLVPSRIIQMDSLPLSPSGKLNLKMLPKVYQVTDTANSNIESPLNEVEEVLCTIWSEILKIDKGNILKSDNFFSLGGDSLIIIQFISLVRDKFDYNLTVPDVIQYPTIAEMAEIIVQGAAKSRKDLGILRAQTNQVVHPSCEQEQLLFIEEYENGTNAYNIHLIYALATDIKISFLTSAITQVLKRNSILRTIYQQDASNWILHELSIEEVGEVLQVREVGPGKLENALVQESKRVFCLSSEVPFSAVLFSFDNQFILSIVFHHICFDAHSQSLFEDQLRQFYYDAYHRNTNGSRSVELSGEKETVSNEPYQYKDFALWQHANESKTSSMRYWTHELENFEQSFLRADFQRPLEPKYEGSEINFSISRNTTDCLKEISKSLKVSMNCLLSAAYLLALRHLTEKDDVTTFIPVGTRPVPEFSKTIGFFSKLLPLRIAASRETNMSEFVVQVQRKILGLLKNSDVAINRLMSEAIDSGKQHTSLSTVFSTRYQGETERSAHPDQLHLKKYNFDQKYFTPAKFEIFVEVVEGSEDIFGIVSYQTAIFDELTIIHLTEQYTQILDQMAKSGGLGQIGKLKSSLFNSSLGSETWREMDKSEEIERLSLTNIFQSVVDECPNHVSAVYKEQSLTYQELNSKSNQLAHYMRLKYAVNAGSSVALFLDKDLNMIISILAVLKCGASFIPLDVDHPRERTKYITLDTKVKLTICHERHLSKVSPSGIDINDIVLIDDTQTMNSISMCSPSNLKIPTLGHATAYVIYTSGTTGKPKGVPITHQSVISFFNALCEEYFIKHKLEISSVLFLSNYAFDFSIEQLLLSLFRGKTLVLPPHNPAVFDKEFYNYVNCHNLDFVSGTPSFLSLCNFTEIKNLQVLVLAGEAFTSQHYQLFRQQFRGTMIQAYGTTETTVYNTYKIYKGAEKFVNSIGIALPNTSVYILDKDLQEAQMGDIGELCLSGECLASGYLNKPDLSRKFFVEIPHPRESGNSIKVYRTGDLVKYNPTGEVEYIGRNDRQISLHGLRIETEEIESLVSSFEGVKQAVVILNRSNMLSCFLVPQGSFEINKDMLRSYLESKLPINMIPRCFFQIEQLPLTLNGKLDQNELENIQLRESRLQKNDKVSPRNELEAHLCQVWDTILGTTGIGIDDDFFLSGGDSIMSMHLVSEIKKKTNLAVCIKDIFMQRTIRKLASTAQIITNKVEANDLNLPSTVDLLPIQKWFFAKDLDNRNIWNHCFAIKVPCLTQEYLRECINKLTHKHGAFNLRFFKTEDGLWKQKVQTSNRPCNVYDIDASKLTKSQIKSRLTEYQKGFDLEKGPTFCVAHIHNYGTDSSMLWFAMHHLIVDTVSWRIITEDLESMYSKGTALDDFFKSTTYATWAHQLRYQALSEKEVAYWQTIREAFSSQADPNNWSYHPESSHSVFYLTQQTSNKLLVECNHSLDTTANELLLTALAYSLKDISKKDLNFITLEGHGREDILGLDVTETVGWFTTMFPIALQVKEELVSSILEIRDMVRNIPDNGIGYGLIHGYTDGLLPKMSFNYLGVLSRSVKTSDNWTLVDDFSISEFPLARSKTNRSIVDITAAVFDGCLKVEILSHLGKDITHKLAESFRINIIEITRATSRDQANNFQRCDMSEVQNYVEQNPITDVCQKKVDDCKNTMNCIIKNGYKTLDYPRNGYFDLGSNLNSHVLQSNGDMSFDPMITFEVDSLFVLPPGEGGAESYLNNIVPHLRQHFNMHLFNNIYLHRGTSSCFEELADFYIHHILSIKKTGPIHLLGWSFGGVLCLEIALQLTKRNIPIGKIFMIDSYFNISSTYKAIGCPSTAHVVDEINLRYTPCPKTIGEMQQVSSFKIILFKASEMPQKEMTALSSRFYKFFLDQPFNNLDCFIPKSKLTVQMIADNHYDWVHNASEVKKLCMCIEKMMTLTRNSS